MPSDTSTVLGPNLNTYCQSTSLLFQFTLYEFITSFKRVLEIEKTYEIMESELIKQRLKGDVKSYLDSLLEQIPLLIGAQMVMANEQTFPWTHSKGSLNKLRHYSYLLSQKCIDQDDIANMNVCVSKAFHSALQIRDVIFSLKRQAEDPEKIPNYVSLYRLLDRLIDNMKRVSRVLLKILIQFKEDENILFFLLRYKSDLDQLYKTQFVTKILQKMYPEGHSSMKEYIKKQYQQRGFLNLISIIEEQISQLN